MAEDHGFVFTGPPRPAPIVKTDPTNSLAIIAALDRLIDNAGLSPHLAQPLRDERRRHCDETGLSLAQARDRIRRKGQR
jgi:hypothetical protein